MSRRGQALVELALLLPVLVMVALGAAQFTRLAGARSALDAATAAAASAAARAPDPTSATASAQAAFAGVAGGYRLTGAALALDLGGFDRGANVTARGSAPFRLGVSTIPVLGLDWTLTAIVSARVEDWRSRAAPP